MRESFAEFLEGAHEQLGIDQDLFLSKYQINTFQLWDFDRDSSVFSLFKVDESVHFSYQAIGTFSEETQLWRWAWDNDDLYPNEKILAQKIRAFGLAHQFDLLNTPRWETERDEGWDILAIVHKVQKNLGYYRIPQDKEHLFVAFTAELSLDEAESRIKGETEMIVCEKHGLQPAAYVCSHLTNGHSTGFNEPFSKLPMITLDENEGRQAWCDSCEEVRAKEGEWNEKSEAFADVQLVCQECFNEIKERKKVIQ